MALRGAKFTYSIKADSGFRSKMEGRLRSPDHHAVVSSACDGVLSDDLNVLLAAPDLLEALKRFMGNRSVVSGMPLAAEAARKAIAKAEGRV